MSEPMADIFESVVLRPIEPDESATALLSWHAPQLGNRAVQVYVNGSLVDAIVGVASGETWLHLDRTRAAMLELLAVDASAMWTDHADRLAGWSPAFTMAASLGLVRDESLPVDAEVVVTIDGVDQPAAALWSPLDSRNGFGGLFGVGSFGLDDATGPGHGMGEFGAGPFGSDGDAWRWRSDDLAIGEHELAIRVHGPTTGEIDAVDGVTVSIDGPPTPASQITIDDAFTLSW